MDTDVAGQVGGMGCDDGTRRALAGQAAAWRCGACGKTNEEILRERANLVEKENGDGADEAKEKQVNDVVPAELKLAYREDLDSRATNDAAKSASSSSQIREVQHRPQRSQQTIGRPLVQRRRTADVWLDYAIFTVTTVLALAILRRILLFIA